ncbi:hypothetical protein DFJ73DRAFT_270636 [Zopfochytrium polystomum]|nr:hypothetical protein DFJ73DRAFT_270636 [Zopfochytrium polystomum]
MQFVPVTGYGAARLAGSTLVLPAPKNAEFLGQMAVDLVLANRDFKRVGFILSKWLNTSFEVYFHDGPNPTTIIQFRSTVAPKRGTDFAADLLQWISASSFKRVILLAGADAGRRFDAQLLMEAPVQYHASQCETDALPSFAIPLEEFENFTADGEVLSKLPPGVGLAHVINVGLQELGIPTLVLVSFVAEGDNAHRATALATVVDSLFNPGGVNSGDSWKFPLSWRDILPGRSTIVSLFQ